MSWDPLNTAGFLNEFMKMEPSLEITGKNKKTDPERCM
jgi:hypothetical protein